MESAASLVIPHIQCKTTRPELYVDRLAEGGVVAFAGPNPSPLRTGHAPVIAVFRRTNLAVGGGSSFERKAFLL